MLFLIVNAYNTHIDYYILSLQSMNVAVFVSSSGHANTPVRLSNGNNYGTVRVYHGGRWGTICGDNFDDADAEVICRMQGYSEPWYVNDSLLGQAYVRNSFSRQGFVVNNVLGPRYKSTRLLRVWVY